MAVYKGLTQFDIGVSADAEDPIEVEIAADDMADDGSITVDFGDPNDFEAPQDIPHDANLAEFIDESELAGIAHDLIDLFYSDRMSRKDWADAYVKGLDLLGFKAEDRTQPWQGASGVFHPMMAEAAIRFQAQAMGELFPPSGPARTSIVGKVTSDIIKQSQRVENEINYVITEQIPDYRTEMEQMLFRLPLAGSAFKKVYYDVIGDCPASTFVPAEDFVIQYGASSLRACPRYTHVMRKDKNEIYKLQDSGFYRDIDLGTPSPEQSAIQKKYDDLDGDSPDISKDDRFTILEMHVDLNLSEELSEDDEIARPYVVTVDLDSMKILSIRRNWYEGDVRKRKRIHFVHYPYLPGLGFYGVGLIHLIGGLTKSATSILRQLIDAGTLANLPAGLKAKGLRIKGDNSPMRPGEFRDVDVPGGAIRDAITFLPYKEPSSVLHQLLGDIVEEGRRIGSVADIQIGDMSAQAPVGTTLALLERNLKVMSGVQARLHASMKDELRLIAAVIRDFMPENYSYDVGGDFSRLEDFNDKVDIIPVSDPNASTMAQRIMQYQAALQLSTQAPQLYDLGKLHRQMLEVLGIQDAADIIKLPDDIKQKDPVSENMAILKQEPVKAFMYQDHEAHISVHMAAMQDPKIQQIVGQSPFASAIQNAMTAHITEHVAMQYRKEIEAQLGVALPSEDEPMPEDVEIEVSRLTKMAADRLLQKNQAEAQQQQAQQQAQDPVIQLQQAELQLKKMEIEGKLDIENKKLQIAAQNSQQNISVQRERLASEDKREGARLGVRIASQIDDAARNDKAEGIRLGIDMAKQLSNNQVELERISSVKDTNNGS